MKDWFRATLYAAATFMILVSEAYAIASRAEPQLALYGQSRTAILEDLALQCSDAERFHLVQFPTPWQDEPRRSEPRGRSQPPEQSRPSASQTSPETAFIGRQGTGQDGCYFGICPQDVARSPEYSPPTPSRQPSVQIPQRSPQIPPPTSQVSQICMTQVGFCFTPGLGPVGAPCGCVTLAGVFYGQMIPQR